jgi:hypothetical protein
MSTWSAMIGLGKCMGALGLCAVVFWEAAEQAGPEVSELVVHVSEIGVDVTVDGLEYTVDGFEDMPVVCSVRAGRHLLRMSRAGKVLYEEAFTIRRGEDKVLTAWDSTRLGMADGTPPVRAVTMSTIPPCCHRARGPRGRLKALPR